MTTARAWLKGILFVFVVFTAGYAVGKEVGMRRVPVPSGEPSAASAVGKAVTPPTRRLVARYYHATKRCVTCNKIEAQAKAALESRFPELLADGRIVWETANMDAVWNADAVRRYGLVRSSLVFLDMDGSVEDDHVVLNRAWELYDEPARFADYVESVVGMITEYWDAEEDEESSDG